MFWVEFDHFQCEKYSIQYLHEETETPISGFYRVMEKAEGGK